MLRKKFVAAWLIIISLIVMAGCSTTPDVRENEYASFSGNVLNSGIVEFRPDGAVINSSGRDFYNDLAAKHGKKLSPPVAPDFGVSEFGSNWLMTYEAMAKWHLLILKADAASVNKAKPLIKKIL